MFSLCIPTMDRYDKYLSRFLKIYLEYENVSEIVITDENGNDIEKILKNFGQHPKLKLFKNETRLGAFYNKLKVCQKASNEWIALIDSDNYAPIEYFNNAKHFIENNDLTNNSIIAPVKAGYRHLFHHFEGLITKNTIPNEYNWKVLFNTGNFILNKFLINNINLEEIINFKIGGLDVVCFLVLLFEQLDLQFHVVKNMEYDHTHNDNGIYLTSIKDIEVRHFEKYIYQRLQKLSQLVK